LSILYAPMKFTISTTLCMLLSRQTTQTMFARCGIPRATRGKHVLVSLRQGVNQVLADLAPSEAIPI